MKKCTSILSLTTLSLSLYAIPTPSLQAMPLSQAAPLRIAAQPSNPFTVESPTFFENRLRGFVYTWFSLFDSNAPHETFLKRMVNDKSLEFRFPEATLKSKADFRQWYDGILKNIRLASHTINDIRIQQRSQREFIIYIDVLWRGTPYQGEIVNFHAQQEWHVTVQGNDYNDIRIRKYLVSPKV